MRYTMPLPRTAKLSPLVASAMYLAFGTLWITFSDAAGRALFDSRDQLSTFQSLKGLLFVATSSLLVYFLVRDRCALRAAVPHAGRTWPLSLGAMLALMMLALEAPLIGVAAWTLHREGDSRMAQARSAAAGWSNVSSSAIGEMMLGYATLADVIAAEDAGAAGLRRACDRGLRQAVDRRAIVAALVLDAEGRSVCGAAGRNHSGAVSLLPLRAPNAGQDLLFGSPEQLPGSGEWVVSVLRILHADSGETLGGLQLVLALRELRPAIAAALPPGGVATILASDGHVIARSAEEARYIGSQPKTALAKRVVTAGRGVEQATGIDGVERLYAFHPVPRTPWFAVVALPTAELTAIARDSAAAFAAVVALLVGLTTWLAYRLARHIGGPIAELKRTAERVEAGRLDVRAPVRGPCEVQDVARGFNRMMDVAQDVLGKLREGGARSRSLVEMAPDGICVHVAGALTDTNRRFRSMFGLASAGGDAALVALVQGEAAPAFAARLRRLGQRPGEGEPMLLRMRAPDGSCIDVEHTCSSVLQGETVVLQSHFLDVTARNRAIAQLEDARQMLERKVAARTADLARSNAALESFSYSVAHDLRSPVGRVSGFASALLDAVDRGDEARVRHYAGRVQQNAQHMAEMIEALLQVARVAREGVTLGRVDMRDLVVREVDQLGAGGIRWQVGELPDATCDRILMRQVWQNLLGNAAKYAGSQDNPWVEVSGRREGGRVVFEVADNGIGIEEADVASLFQTFGRLPNAVSFPGAGVGLALVKRIVERHGGTLWARPRPGGGACFGFSLPDVA